jgi:choline dehydrogenase-like flavoprotein
MPRAVIDWRMSPLDVRTLHAFAELFKEEWERLELGRIELSEAQPTIDGLWQDNMRDTYHHMGTTRMSSDPRLGVVDRDCRVHGLENLYVGSSSVFPTSGNSNPTLTILALCLRLANHLKAKQKPGVDAGTTASTLCGV